MEVNFKNEEHEKRFNELLERDRTADNDLERKSLFFIISGSDTLFINVNELYSFKERNIHIEEFIKDNLDIDINNKKLLYLGFQLYNNFKFSYFDTDIKDYSILDILSYQAVEDYELCMNAINLRFNKKLNI